MLICCAQAPCYVPGALDANMALPMKTIRAVSFAPEMD